jgi:hypothetical protein
MKKIEEQTAELERLRQQVLLSNGQGHPLSGITGYGSRPKQFAKNNLLRMFQGREPLPYNENNSPARSGSDRRSESHHLLSGSRSRLEDTSESGSERPSTTVPDPNPTLGKRNGEYSIPVFCNYDLFVILQIGRKINQMRLAVVRSANVALTLPQTKTSRPFLVRVRQTTHQATHRRTSHVRVVIR